MKSLCALFLSIQFLLMGSTQPDLPAPYNEVDLLPFNPQGWYSNAKSMKQLITTSHAKVVIEVGSWFGASTRHIAQTLPADGIVYAVDPWTGSPGQMNFNDFDMPNVYRQFLSNVIHAKLTHKIIPIKMPSVEAAKVLDVKPDLIYIDGYHDFENVYNDLKAWFPFVKGHGILCGDDYYYYWENGWPVKQAVDLFAKENNLIVHDMGWFWYYQEKELEISSSFQ